ncbi:MAG: hypothetical protein AB7P40_01115 [Chloroflexota bacterium]
MRNLLFLAVGVLLALGIFFARDRVKRACQLGAVLYAVVLVVRLVVYGFEDSDNFLSLLTVGAVFLAIWGIGWAATQAVIEHRNRTQGPPS